MHPVAYKLQVTVHDSPPIGLKKLVKALIVFPVPLSTQSITFGLVIVKSAADLFSIDVQGLSSAAYENFNFLILKLVSVM